MYLRYGDPSWDLADPAETGDPSAGAAGAAGAADSAAGVPSPAAPGSNGKGNGANGRWSRRREPGTGIASATRSPATRRLPVVSLHGVALHAITEAQTIRHILDELAAGRGGVVVTPNLDHLRRAAGDVHFSAMVAEADLVVADGMPLVWASRFQGTPLPERVAGSNLISTLSAGAAAEGRSLFLLGGDAGTADRAAQVLRERYPAATIAGTYFPPLGFEDKPAVMGELVQRLTDARPDIVYVALGSPKQEKLIARLRHLLPQTWWLGVGVSFSFLCGDVRRAPPWMQRCGMEWVHRLRQEPGRLFKRYILSGLPFAAGLLARSALQGIPNRLGRKPKRALAAAAAATEAVAPATALRPTPAGANGNGHESYAAPRIAAPAAVTQAVAVPHAAGAVESANGGELSLARLRAVILLGGSVRPSPLALAAGRSVLDLPLDEHGSVLNGWLDQAAALAQAAGLGSLPVRVLVNQGSPEPVSADARHFGTFRVERDLSEYRGTGGVLRDLANDYADDDLILVANAAQILVDPLAKVVTAMAALGGDVSVVAHADGTPSGLMLVACKTLRLIADTGFVDMKEQALPRIAQSFDVRVLSRRRPTGLPVRTLEDYIQGLRYHHRRKSGKSGSAASDPLAEDWDPAFALVEPGANLRSPTRIHDSVVLHGATVEAGAVLVRSVVCPDGVVKANEHAVDRFVSGPHRGRAFEPLMDRAKPAPVVTMES